MHFCDQPNAIATSSRSVWPCVMVHGAHNLFVLAVMDAATVKAGWGAWGPGEFGIGITAMAWIAALVVLRTPRVAPA